MSGLMNPENAEKGQGFLEGREVLVLDAGWAQYDADGKFKTPAACYWMELEADGLEKPVTQYWSIGKPDVFKPSKDGNSIQASKGMNEKCNLYLLATSLVNAGLDQSIIDKIDEDAKVLVGYRFRMGVVIKNKDDKYGTPIVDEILGSSLTPEDEAVSLVNKILGMQDGAVELKNLPVLLTKVGANPEAKKVVMGKGWLVENFTVTDGVVTA